MADSGGDAKLRQRLADLGIDPSEALDESTTLGAATLVARGGGVPTIRSAASLPKLPPLDLGPVGSEPSRDLVALSVLGEGGMGQVLLARQTALQREVAVKVPKEGASAADVDSLVREALIAGALEHPSIVPVYALGVGGDGRPLLVMRRVEGVDWGTLLLDSAHPAWKTHLGVEDDRLGANLDIVVAICRALELAHLRGLLHRDVKPSNVMLGRFGEVYLVDWGLAAPVGTAEGFLVGTPGYMAPEMATGDTVDETTDVYLLGATLHRAIVGATRHRGDTSFETVLAAKSSLPFSYPAGVPGPLADLCNRACSASKSDRPSSVRAFREELAAFKRRWSAIAICEVAQERLGRLERLLVASDDAVPSDLALAYRLVTEARFGFAQGLEQFPNHPEARAGAIQSVELLVDLELRQGHIETAAVLLEELPEPATSPLAERLAAARDAVHARAEEHARLRALDRELDPSVGWRFQAAVLLGIAIFQLGLNIAGHVVSGPVLTGSAGGLIVAAIVPLVIVGALSLSRRRRLVGNQFAERGVGMIALVLLASLVNRIAGWHRGASLGSILSADLVLGALGVSAAAITLIPHVAIIVPILVVSIAATELYPAYATTTYTWTVSLCLGLAAWAVWRNSRLRHGLK